jgi:hypothetical protein
MALAMKLMVRPEGFEPPTPWFEAKCSIQMSYGRDETLMDTACSMSEV